MHSSYGQYLSDDQVHQLVQPTEETLASVENWLEDFGFDTSSFEYSPARDWIKFTADVGTVEELLNTTYFIYEHEDGSTLVRTEAWSLPANLHEHVTTIQPTNSFARLHGRSKPRREIQKRSTNYIKVDEGGLTDPSSTVAAPTSVPSIAADPAAVSGVCNFSSVTPLCLRTLYGTLSYTPKVPGKNKMGLTNYLGEYNNRSDASIFLEAYRPEMAAAAYQYTQVSIAGGDIDNGTNTADQAPDTGFEGNLDVQYMLGIGYPTPLTTYSTGGRNPTFMPDALTTTNSDEPYLVFANYITGQPKSAIPQVISTSYGDDEQTVSKSYAEAVCNQFAQLGAKGVSIMFASGDNGVGPTGLCVSNADNTTRKFLPSFPNDCPYVTNVGATTEFPETAAYDTFSDGSIFTSGAGFSEYFSQPKYQAKVVQDYVAGLGGLYEGLYNPSGKFIKFSFPPIHTRARPSNPNSRSCISRPILQRPTLQRRLERFSRASRRHVRLNARLLCHLRPCQRCSHCGGATCSRLHEPLALWWRLQAVH